MWLTTKKTVDMLEYMIKKLEEQLSEFENTALYPFEKEFLDDIKKVIEVHRGGKEKWVNDPKRKPC